MFHTSGITLALSAEARETAMTLIRKMKESGALISFDCNYRANLWGEDEAREMIRSILPYVDILFVSEETSRRMMRKTGELHEIMKGYTEEFPIRYVCTTRRTVISPKKHDFTSIIYAADEDRFYEEEPYRDIEIVDRIGSGDAYVAGVLYGILASGDPADALRYGNAASAIKNTIPGDLPASERQEIERVIREHAEGAVGEMER